MLIHEQDEQHTRRGAQQGETKRVWAQTSVHGAQAAPVVSAAQQNPAEGLLEDQTEDRLEDAVDQACAPLIGTLPRAKRLARRAALRQELDTLVQAHGELDAYSERALAEALAHFARLHPAPHVHRTPSKTQQNHARQIVEPRSLASTRPATLLALSLLVPIYLGHALNLTEALRGPLHFNGPAQDRLELLAAPLIVGLFVGLLTRARAVRGMFNACAALAVYTVGIPSLFAAISQTGLWPYQYGDFYSRLAIDPLAGYVGLVVWPLLGCGGAWAGAALRRRAKQVKLRRTRAVQR